MKSQGRAGQDLSAPSGPCPLGACSLERPTWPGAPRSARVQSPHVAPGPGCWRLSQGRVVWLHASVSASSAGLRSMGVSVDLELCARGHSVPLAGLHHPSVCTVAVGGVGRGKEDLSVLALSSEATHTRAMLSALWPGRSREAVSPWPAASALDASTPRGFEVPFSTFVPPLPLPSPAHARVYKSPGMMCQDNYNVLCFKKPWLCVVGETKGGQTQLLALAAACERWSRRAGSAEPGCARGGGALGSRSSACPAGISPVSGTRALWAACPRLGWCRHRRCPLRPPGAWRVLFTYSTGGDVICGQHGEGCPWEC